MVGAVSAQDMESATKQYNDALMTMNSGDKVSALVGFEQALKDATVIGPDAADLANNCKTVIPKLCYYIGQDLAKEKKYEAAVAQEKKAISKAKEFGNTEFAKKANDLIADIYLGQGNDLINSKDYKGASVAYNKSVQADPTNAMAFLRLGMAASRSGQESLAIEAYEKASALGQKTTADAQLSKYFVMKANSLRINKSYEEAMEYAKKSSDVMPNALAYKLYAISAISCEDYKAAAEGFKEYLTLSPNAKDADAMKFQLATSLEKLGENAEACEYYKQLINNPKFKEYAASRVKALS